MRTLPLSNDLTRATSLQEAKRSLLKEKKRIIIRIVLYCTFVAVMYCDRPESECPELNLHCAHIGHCIASN